MKHLAVLLVVLTLSFSAIAATECDRLFNGQRVCVTGILTESFDEQEAYDPQEKAFWCWAASISMIMKWYGYDVSQPDIVKQTFGSNVNRPAYGFHITRQLNRTYTASDGRKFEASAKVFDLMSGRLSVSGFDVIRALEQERPLVIGAQGHAMVLTAVYYIRNPDGKPAAIVGGIVRDPWPGRGRRELSIQELFPQYLADVSIAGAGSQPNPKDQERVHRCMESCEKQSSDCQSIADDEKGQCSVFCDRSHCDHCATAHPALAEACDRNCERCTKACEKQEERKVRRCDSERERCASKCK